jgi:thiosulfate reductase/polysulfide reductase chain A
MAIEVKRIVCGFCASHCRYKVRVENGLLLGADLQKRTDSPMAERWRKIVAACPRALAAPEFLYHPNRLNYPLKRAGERGGGQWQQISWEHALDEIAEKLAEIKGNYGTEALAITTSGEQNSADEYRVRFQSLYGTPNLLGPPSCGVGMTLSHLLTGWMDYLPYIRPETRCIMLLGANPAAAAPQLWNGIREFQKFGVKLIVVDPRGTDPAVEANLWLQPRPGTDAALLLGMINTIISEGLYDNDFVDRWCHGFDKLVERARDYPLQKVADITGVAAEKIGQAARMYATTKPGLIFHVNGLEEQANATQALHARYILAAITGNIDVAGGDALLEPHPSVRLVANVELLDKMSDEQKNKMIGGGRFKLYSWPVFERLKEIVEKTRERPLSSYWISGYAHAPSVFRAMIDGKPYPVKAMITVAKNPLLTFPNAKLIYDALMKLDLHVAMDVFMTPTCQIADYVLPAACGFEKPIIHGGDYFLHLQAGEAAVAPLYERKPEYYFWRELGIRLGQKEYWPWKTLEEAYDYRLAPLGVTFREFMDSKGYDNPPLRQRKYEEKGFGTPTGKFELYSTILEELGYDPLPSYTEPPRSPVSDPKLAKDFPLTLLSGGRNRRYYHSQDRQLESIRRRSPDPIAQISPELGSQQGLNAGDWMWIETPMGRAEFKCKYLRGLDPRVVQAEHGWWFPEETSPDSLWRSNINALLDDDPDICDPVSGNYVLRGQLCKVYKSKD